MMYLGPTWKGKVRRIEEVAERDHYPEPTITLTLEGWYSAVEIPLPRATEVYWLVSDAVFKRLTGNDE